MATTITVDSIQRIPNTRRPYAYTAKATLSKPTDKGGIFVHGTDSQGTPIVPYEVTDAMWAEFKARFQNLENPRQYLSKVQGRDGLQEQCVMGESNGLTWIYNANIQRQIKLDQRLRVSAVIAPEVLAAQAATPASVAVVDELPA